MRNSRHPMKPAPNTNAKTRTLNGLSSLWSLSKSFTLMAYAVRNVASESWKARYLHK